MLRRFLKNIGPGPLVAAAFIGPGTVTLCTLVGVAFGFQLLWAIILSIGAAIVLQGMAVRIGIIGRKSIIGVIRERYDQGWRFGKDPGIRVPWALGGASGYRHQGACGHSGKVGYPAHIRPAYRDPARIKSGGNQWQRKLKPATGSQCGHICVRVLESTRTRPSIHVKPSTRESLNDD